MRYNYSQEASPPGAPTHHQATSHLNLRRRTQNPCQRHRKFPRKEKARWWIQRENHVVQERRDQIYRRLNLRGFSTNLEPQESDCRRWTKFRSVTAPYFTYRLLIGPEFAPMAKIWRAFISAYKREPPSTHNGNSEPTSNNQIASANKMHSSNELPDTFQCLVKAGETLTTS